VSRRIIMIENLKNLLQDGANEFGIKLSDHQVQQFNYYKDILKGWNEKINLTAIEDDKEVIIKHFIDSLSIIPFLQKSLSPIAHSPLPGLKLIDVGTGAGFPGIPLKIVYKNLKVTLLDSLDKRVKFLNEVVNKLDLAGIDAVHGRAEDFGNNREFREQFDISVARAVANLPVLLEYCMPFIKVNGKFIAMKGSSMEEVDASKRALAAFGGEIEEIKEIILPSSDIKRNIIIVRKLRHTPTKYPRKAGKPSREPLI